MSLQTILRQLLNACMQTKNKTTSRRVKHNLSLSNFKTSANVETPIIQVHAAVATSSLKRSPVRVYCMICVISLFKLDTVIEKNSTICLHKVTCIGLSFACKVVTMMWKNADNSKIMKYSAVSYRSLCSFMISSFRLPNRETS